MIKTKLLLPVIAAVAALALLAGCGSDDSGSGSSDPATVAPADTTVFIEAKVQPTGSLKTNIEGLAKKLADVDDLGGLIVSLIESEASDSDEPIDFDKDVQPWLGESAGIFLNEYDGEDFQGGGFALEVTDTGEAQEFLDKLAENEDPQPEDASYDGHDYKIDPDGENAVGIVGSLIVFGEDKAAFEASVDAAGGDSLADTDNYGNVSPANPEASLADVYVDIGGLIKSAGSEVDPDALKFFEAAGVEPARSSALMSLIPGSNNVEIEVASKLTGEQQSAVPSTDAAELLGSMPANSVAALSAGNIGDSIGQVVDTIDEQGIPGEVPAGEFKDTLKQAGIDLDKITGNLGDAAVYVQGRTLPTLGGAMVIETANSNEAQSTVANVGNLLRANNVPGVTAVKQGATGFSVRDAELGRQPVVVAAKGSRVAIGYGLEPTLTGLDSASGPTLAKTKAYNEALNALGSTPITGFAAGRPAVRLLEGLATSTEDREEIEEVAPYLSRVPFLAVGAETKDEVARARLILGVTE